METQLYNQKAEKLGKLTLPDKIFGIKWNTSAEALVHQVVVSMMGNKRHPWAHTKNRGEVSGTGKKPWKQKGTGRARHGSRRSPIWVGGGVAHGPRKDRAYDRKINKNMRAKALFTILSKKFNDGEIIFVDSIYLKEPKTKLAKEVLVGFNKNDFKGIATRKNAAFLAFSDKNENNLKGFRNFNNIEVGSVKDLNPVDVLGYKYVVIENPEMAFKTLNSRMK